MKRRDKVVQYLDVSHGRGLEIGPLMAPIVTPADGEIYYLDHASTEDLRAKYEHDPAVSVDRITPVDFVWGAQTIAEATSGKAPFDYVVASHVMEHVPDLLGWLNEITTVLRPGGRIGLALPDRRFTFDVRRRPSDVPDVIEAYLLKLRRPSVRATFDHFYRFVEVNVGQRWHGEVGYKPTDFDYQTALALATTSAVGQEYVDTHCWVFSDKELLELLRLLAQTDLLRLSVAGFTPTAVGDHEFFITLELPPEELSPAEKKQLILDSIARFELGAFPSLLGVTPTPENPDSGLSPREQQLIEAKRTVGLKLRSTWARLRRS